MAPAIDLDLLPDVNIRSKSAIDRKFGGMVLTVTLDVVCSTPANLPEIGGIYV